eukprot:5606536-Pyramimonas_sp.AAC.1
MLSVFFTQLALRADYSAGGDRNRKDIRRVRPSNPELGTESAARIRSAKLLYCSSHPERCC